MGGGGGGPFLGSRPGDVAQSIRRLETEAQGEDYESAVASFLGGVLAAANNRDRDAVAAHLEAIRAALVKDIEGSVDLLFGGSVAKNTYVHGISDIDALVVINNSALLAMLPREVCRYIEQRLREGFPQTEVAADGFAIDIRFNDVTVQVVPAIRRGDDYLLPDNECKTWSHVRPKQFTDALTSVNKTYGNKVVPTIKLAKALMSALPDTRRISGYHAELLATRLFEQYKGPLTPKAMLHHFFAAAPALVREPTRDPTGQSAFVDDHLGPPNSLERLMIADSLARIGRRLRNADGARSVDQWRELFQAVR